MRVGSKLVGYGQFFRQVAVKNVVGVIFNVGEEVIIIIIERQCGCLRPQQ